MNRFIKNLGCVFLLTFVCLSSYAKTIDIKSTHAYTEDETYYLDALFNIQLTEEALKALRHGIALEIHTQFQLHAEREWLWNKKINEITLMHRLEHHPLTEDYLTINLKTGLRLSYSNLESALNYISSISKMALFNKDQLKQENKYIGRIRAYVDIESLPSPIRPQAYFSPNWDISSEWYEWEVIQ